MTRTIALIILILAASSPAVATTARVLGLGGDGHYLEDTTGVLRWYGSLVDHPDLATLELADVTGDGDSPGNAFGLPGHGGGAHLRLDDAGRWGTAAFYLEDDLPGDTPGGAFTGLWARQFGPAGVGLYAHLTTYGDAMVASAASDHGYSEYDHHYGLGLRLGSGGDSCVDIAAEVINHRTESLDAIHHLLPRDEWTSFGFRSRAFLKVSETTTLVPMLDHLTDRNAVYAVAIAGPADREAALTQLGVGFQVRRTDASLLLVSAEYRGGHEDLDRLVEESVDAAWDTSRREFWQIRGRLGVESSALAWLTLRAAVQYVRIDEQIRRSSATGHENVDHETVKTPIFLGLGARWHDFTVDLVYNDTAPVNPGLLTDGAGRDGITCLSVSYAFR